MESPSRIVSQIPEITQIFIWRTKHHMAQMTSAVSSMGTERLEEEIEEILQWY